MDEWVEPAQWCDSTEAQIEIQVIESIKIQYYRSTQSCLIKQLTWRNMSAVIHSCTIKEMAWIHYVSRTQGYITPAHIEVWDRNTQGYSSTSWHMYVLKEQNLQIYYVKSTEFHLCKYWCTTASTQTDVPPNGADMRTCKIPNMVNLIRTAHTGVEKWSWMNMYTVQIVFKHSRKIVIQVNCTYAYCNST